MDNMNPEHDNGGVARHTLGILGCGKLGTSILVGLLSRPPVGLHSGTISLPSGQFLQISKIDVTVKSVSSMKRISEELDGIHAKGVEPRIPVVVHLAEDNAAVARNASIVILGCEPHSVQDILRDSALQTALVETREPKSFISILGGVSLELLQSTLTDRFNGHDAECGVDKQQQNFAIARAIPNIAVRNHESITLIASTGSPAESNPAENDAVRLFNLLGHTRVVHESQLGSAAILAASSLAFYAKIINALCNGTLQDGPEHQQISHGDALWIAAQAARGAAGLIAGGMQPDAVANAVATKGGSTAVGLDVMEKSAVEILMMEAIQASIKKHRAYNKSGIVRQL